MIRYLEFSVILYSLKNNWTTAFTQLSVVKGVKRFKAEFMQNILIAL